MPSSLPTNSDFLFVPQGTLYDAQQIETLDIQSPEFKQFLIQLQNQITTNIDAINQREGGNYYLSEQINGKLFYQLATTQSNAASQNPRQNYRMTVDFGALPVLTKSVAHGITFDANLKGTLVTITATNPTAAPGDPAIISIPYIDVADPTKNIQGYISTTDVVITTGGFDYSAFTSCIVVIEYLKI